VVVILLGESDGGNQGDLIRMRQEPTHIRECTTFNPKP